MTKTTAKAPSKKAATKKTPTKKAPTKKTAAKKAPARAAAAKPVAKKASKSSSKPASQASKKTSKKTSKKGADSASKKSKRGAGDFIFLDHTSEDLFASQLLEEIEYRHGVDVATLDVRIRDGIAVARGTVSDLEELEAVRETMQDAGGITDLTFVVQVAPDRREADRDRARQIQESLDAETDLASDNVVVACVGRKVIVRGSVGTRLRKVKAGLLALRLGDASRIANRLVVLTD